MTEQERIAARAQRFSKLAENATTPPAHNAASPIGSKIDSPARERNPDAPMGPPPVKKEEARGTPQPKSPRRSSPGASARSLRSGSIDSRSSDRLRRPVSEQDRAKEDAERDRARAQRRAQESGSGRNTPVGEAKTELSIEGAAKQKQEELLQARHDRLASDRKPEDRRSSGSRKETESERAERKAKEREEDKQRDKERAAKDEGGPRRGKEEAVSKILPAV